MLPFENYPAWHLHPHFNQLSFTSMGTRGRQANMKSPSGPFFFFLEKNYGNNTFLCKPPTQSEWIGGGTACGSTSFIRLQVLWVRLKGFWAEGRGKTPRVRSAYLPIDHAGPSLVLAVLSREPGGAGAFVLAFLEVHASSVVGAGG